LTGEKEQMVLGLFSAFVHELGDICSGREG
jgi:hypothetical protein